VNEIAKNLKSAQEIADAEGISRQAILDRFKKDGINPAVPSKTGGAGGSGEPALYDYSACKLALASAKQGKIVKTLNECGKQMVLTDTIKALDEDDSKESLQAIFANAAGFVAMLNKKAEKLNSRNTALELEIEELKKQLDISTSCATIETYAINAGLPVSRQKAGMITRELHKRNLKDEGKVPSKFDPSLSATVWRIDILDENIDLFE
jgi:hypothetical protein